MGSRTVRDWMTKRVATCRSGDSLRDAARTMWESGCGCLVALDRHGGVAGIVTDRDLAVCAFLEDRRPAEVRVEHAMSTAVRTCHASDDLERALELLSRHGVRRLPVLDPDGRLCGLLSIDDIAKAAEGSIPLARALVRAMARLGAPRPREFACVADEEGPCIESLPRAAGERAGPK